MSDALCPSDAYVVTITTAIRYKISEPCLALSSLGLVSKNPTKHCIYGVFACLVNTSEKACSLVCSSLEMANEYLASIYHVGYGNCMSVSKIRVLPINVANKIAAGEVVERPSSILKELVENAVDSGAKRVDVEVVDGGRKLVAVSDDGCGMTRDDAILSIERHATSKISDVDDIEKINSLGFRGEALAAISSVSRMRLVTCAQGEKVGTEILISAGTINDVKDIGCPNGTRIEIRDIFFNVPVRRKFLRSQQTELANIKNEFIIQSLSRTNVAMSLLIDGYETYRLPACADLADRLVSLFGSDYVRNLKKLDYSGGEVSVSGYASLPSFSRSDRTEQYVFINGRATSAAVLAYAIRGGYHTLLPQDRHPVVFLFIDMPFDKVDVNVHPTKKEVRFREPSAVRDAVVSCVKQALTTPQTEIQSKDVSIHGSAGSVPVHINVIQEQMLIKDMPVTQAFKYPGIQTLVRSGVIPAALNDRSDAPERSGKMAGSTTDPSPSGSVAPWSWCRVMGQVGNLYVILETEGGMVLMDPHAAHERVLYERFMAAIIHGSLQTQALLMPENVQMRPRMAQVTRDNIDILKSMGFGIAEFGGDNFVLDVLPAVLSGASGLALLESIALEIEEVGARTGKEDAIREIIAKSACKAAVKAQDKLSVREIEQLVIDLASVNMPYTCPHGRPTLIFMSLHELNKKFGRE